MLRLPNASEAPRDARESPKVGIIEYQKNDFKEFLAILPFFSRYISAQDIQSGTLCVDNKSYFLMVVASHVYPVRRIQAFLAPVDITGPRSFASALAASGSFPDIKVILWNLQGPFSGRPGIAKIISAASRGPPKTLVIIRGGTVHVSRQRNTGPIRWKMVPHPIMRTIRQFTLGNLTSDVVGPIAPANLFCGIVNAVVIILWLYRRVFGVQWSQEDRITTDLGRIHGEWMCVQVLLPDTAARFTLMTFCSNRSMRLTLTIRPLLALTPTQRTAVLAALALDDNFNLEKLVIAEGAECALADVLHFARGQPKITSLFLEPGPLLSDSIAHPSPPHAPGTIHELTAPASYIPHILPGQADVKYITISFPASPPSPISSNFDIPACIRALNAVAALPGTHLISLALHFPRAAIDARALPCLGLITDGASGVAMLGRWLAVCFPGIFRLEFPDPGEAQLLTVLREARMRNTGMDIGILISDTHMSINFAALNAEHRHRGDIRVREDRHKTLSHALLPLLLSRIQYMGARRTREQGTAIESPPDPTCSHNLDRILGIDASLCDCRLCPLPLLCRTSCSLNAARIDDLRWDSSRESADHRYFFHRFLHQY
ncbi:hypothetical protein DFH09DRAFT_1082649 [Mycena vulgaris]|nr:hypothetical protein DFH09DRAFT_1082649 [Mycena vulgaris]